MYKPNEIEQRISNFWKRENIYSKVKEAGKGKPKFYFNDGPPYATGQIHPGTAWNKCIKDAICRYKRLKGFNVRSQPGYDTHGLPIEVKVEQSLGFKSKKDIEKYGMEKFIEKCKAFATQYIGVMGEQFKSIGVWMDWENPYITYKDEFIEKSWKTIKKASEKGLLERGVYVLPCCPRCETSIANYELEYGEQTDPSVYLKFKVEGEKNTYLIIWTTTPWTIPGNMAVMVHPDFTYVKAKVDGEHWIVAKERLPAVVAIANPLGLKVKVEEEFSGRKLQGLKYIHPLAEEVPIHKGREFEKFHYVTLSDKFVTLEEGTGLVHTAPGHGPQDYEVGKRDNIPPFCPVDISGRYTNEAGKYAGMSVFEANKVVMEELKEKGLLLHAGNITHRYPHCWRCKSPLIFIVTDQWFIKVSKIREQMLSEIERCKWQPDHARVWFRDFVSNAPDWCISRQRYWGIPLPIWKCDGCNNLLIFGSRSELEKRWGHKVSELHKPQLDAVVLKCDGCEGKMHRVPDVLDVWFDSGNAIWASLSDEEFKEWYPCDFIVEGKDQIRGWFYSLLGSGVVAYDQIPYRSLLMHGHFVDEHGEKMSKSLGNFVPLEEITGKYGADTFRLWSLNSVVWEDLKFNWDELKEASRILGVYWNLHVFLQRMMVSEGFNPAHVKLAEKDFELEDLWLLSRMNSLVRDVTKAMDAYEVHEANRRIREFILHDLSRLYLKLVKKRLAEGRGKAAALKTLYDALFVAVRLTSPFIPFISEEIYQNVFRAHEKAESVFLLNFPECNPSRIDPLLEKQMELIEEIASAAANARQSANIKLRWPLEEAVIITQSTGLRNAVERFSLVLEMVSNVKKVRIEEKSPMSLSFKVNKNKVGAAFKQKAPEITKKLEGMPPAELRERLAEGKFELEVENYKFPITPDMVEFIETPPEGYTFSTTPQCTVLIKTAVNEKLYAEALRREVARRIQMMRKELNLIETESIEVNVVAPKEFLEILEKQEKELSKEVHASKVILSTEKKLSGTEKKWQIEEDEVEIVIKK